MDFGSLEAWGYLAVAFFAFGGSLVIVATAAIFSYMGHMDLYVAMSIAAISNFLGDNFLFYLARYHKDEVSKYLHKHKRKLALTHLLVRKYGTIAVFVQKFLYGVKTLVPIVMGLSKYDFKTFIFYNIFASILFVAVIGTTAYLSSEGVIRFFGYVKENPWIAPLILFSILGGAWYLMESLSKKRG